MSENITKIIIVIIGILLIAILSKVGEKESSNGILKIIGSIGLIALFIGWVKLFFFTSYGDEGLALLPGLLLAGIVLLGLTIWWIIMLLKKK
ncbi:hypothetical protein KA025_01975 [Candidatus Saccharibacteria bacterium]|jgi:hypothetical protein|nr:hypothetical protein [Candidatus Saccharibacteria bacterium]MBP7834834.1 hypothetical protein [Candidatus Saccharibacteria bacterium]